MNILLVLQWRPEPPISGGWQRTTLLAEALQQIGDVYAVYYDNTPEDCPEGDRLKRIRMRRLSRMLHNGFCLPLRAIRAINLLPWAPKPEKSIEEVYPGVKFDVIVCRYYQFTAKHHLWTKGIPWLVDVDDPPLQVYDTMVYKEIPACLRGLGRKVLDRQIAFLESKAAGLWITDPEHQKYLHGDRNVRLLRNIALTPPQDYMRAAAPKKYLLTVGTMSFEPNVHGVSWFLDHIWPQFHLQHPDIEYVIAGRGAPEALTAKFNEVAGVRYLGFVEDLAPLYSECIATVIPINEGGGTCIKTVESLAYRVPCLTTEFGCRGIYFDGGLDDIGVNVFSDAAGFDAAFRKVAENPDRTALESRIASFVAENYSKEQFFKSVRNLVESCLEETNNQ